MDHRPRKTHRFRNFVLFPLLGLVGLIVIVSIATGGGGQQQPTSPANQPATPTPTATPSPQPSPEPQPPQDPTTTVELFGDGEATYTVVTQGSSTNTIQLPHTDTLPEGYVVVSVTRSPSMESYMETGGPDRGQVGCRIIRGGEVVDEQVAEGEFASVSCSKWR
jgi:hypothetical protein